MRLVRLLLREWFARQAPSVPGTFALNLHDPAERYAAWAYHYADKMLKAREAKR